MITAQIKKGNAFLIDNLEDALLQIVTLPENKLLKPIKFTFYQFICLMSEFCGEFVKPQTPDMSFCLFLVDYHVRRYEKDGEVYRHLMGLTQSWKRFIEVHEDAKLFLSLLGENRNSKCVVREFLKIRKIILKTLSQKILSQIQVTHSDALAICHMLHEGVARSKVVKKINQLFISLKRKLLNTAKINGAVACQFFLKAKEEVDLEQYPLQQRKILSNNYQYENGCEYPENISFSEEYASCYLKEQAQNDKSLGISPVFDDFEELEREWEQKNGFGFDQARKSLKELVWKDRDMDAKLKDSGIMKDKNYPEGWEQFLKTNRLMKQKLLNYKAF